MEKPEKPTKPEKLIRPPVQPMRSRALMQPQLSALIQPPYGTPVQRRHRFTEFSRIHASARSFTAGVSGTSSTAAQ